MVLTVETVDGRVVSGDYGLFEIMGRLETLRTLCERGMVRKWTLS